MTWDKVLKLLRQGEGNSVEFKKRINDSMDLAKEIVAFSNADGGYLVLGVDDKNGHLVGETASKEWVEAIAKTKCIPAIEPVVSTVHRGDKNILLVKVFKGNNKPYTTNGKIYIRENLTIKELQENDAQTIEISTNQQEQLSDIKVNSRQKDSLKYVEINESISNKNYRELFNVSHKTAHIELTDLVKHDFLAVKGKGRSTCYVLSD